MAPSRSVLADQDRLASSTHTQPRQSTGSTTLLSRLKNALLPSSPSNAARREHFKSGNDALSASVAPSSGGTAGSGHPQQHPHDVHRIHTNDLSKSVSSSISPSSIFNYTAHRDPHRQRSDRRTAQFASLGGRLGFASMNDLSLERTRTNDSFGTGGVSSPPPLPFPALSLHDSHRSITTNLGQSGSNSGHSNSLHSASSSLSMPPLAPRTPTTPYTPFSAHSQPGKSAHNTSLPASASSSSSQSVKGDLYSSLIPAASTSARSAKSPTDGFPFQAPALTSPAASLPSAALPTYKDDETEELAKSTRRRRTKSIATLSNWLLPTSRSMSSSTVFTLSNSSSGRTTADPTPASSSSPLQPIKPSPSRVKSGRSVTAAKLQDLQNTRVMSTGHYSKSVDDLSTHRFHYTAGLGDSHAASSKAKARKSIDLDASGHALVLPAAKRRMSLAAHDSLRNSRSSEQLSSDTHQPQSGSQLTSLLIESMASPSSTHANVHLEAPIQFANPLQYKPSIEFEQSKSTANSIPQIANTTAPSDQPLLSNLVNQPLRSTRLHKRDSQIILHQGILQRQLPPKPRSKRSTSLYRVFSLPFDFYTSSPSPAQSTCSTPSASPSSSPLASLPSLSPASKPSVKGKQKASDGRKELSVSTSTDTKTPFRPFYAILRGNAKLDFYKLPSESHRAAMTLFPSDGQPMKRGVTAETCLKISEGARIEVGQTPSAPISTVLLAEANISLLPAIAGKGSSTCILLHTADGERVVMQAPTRTLALEWIAKLNDARKTIEQRRASYVPICSDEALKDLSIHASGHQQAIKSAPDRLLATAVFGLDLLQLVARDGTDVPLVVMQMLDNIERTGLQEVGLYRLAGTEVDIRDMRTAIDQGQMIADVIRTQPPWKYDVHNLANLCKRFFREMPEIIAFPAYIDFMQASNISEYELRMYTIRDLIWTLPKPHFDLIKRLCRHLAQVAEYEQYSGMTANNLATVFAPTVFKPPLGPNHQELLIRNLNSSIKLVSILITQQEWLFSFEEEEEQGQAEQATGIAGEAADEPTIYFPAIDFARAEENTDAHSDREVLSANQLAPREDEDLAASVPLPQSPMELPHARSPFDNSPAHSQYGHAQ